MTAYRVAAVVVKEPEVAWADRPKAAFARGETRYARRHLYPLLVGLAVIAGGVAALALGRQGIGATLLVVGFFATLFSSRSDRGHDPTQAVHEHAQDDLVAWAEAIAEHEGPRVIGSAIAGVLFGIAAEREGAHRTALAYYEAALDDVATLRPENIVKEIARLASVRGALAAHAVGEASRARTLVEKRERLFATSVPETLSRLPSLTTSMRFAALLGELDEAEERLCASLA